MRTIVWFRDKDLRVSDHKPLHMAVASGEVIPLFVLEPDRFGPGSARGQAHRVQYLVDALHTLDRELRRLGSRLVLVAGRSVDLVPRLADEWQADLVAAHRCTEPSGRNRDTQVAEDLGDRFQLYEGETLASPGAVLTAAGRPYQVFSQFARTFERVVDVGEPTDEPSEMGPVPRIAAGHAGPLPTCHNLGIERNDNVIRGGETEARARLARTAEELVIRYADERDRLDLATTSRLSADLRFGCLSPRQVWHAVRDAHPSWASSSSFLRQLVWREFSYDTLWHRPDVVSRPFRREFLGFPWRTDAAQLTAWEDGRTGYPIVDAAARQLLAEGFVHNRARMVAASFLSKHLLLDYRLGEGHYLRYLVDGDTAQNSAGWQWATGCGCGAQPYFRVFNPVRQGERFDPDGDYVRRWIPELSTMPSRFIHHPWDAPAAVLHNSGVELGRTYPEPIVEHGATRDRFLRTARSHFRRPEAGFSPTAGPAPSLSGVGSRVTNGEK